ncbi:hypothetical protein HIM_01720 [Hirsutella minnesotensis 3608]|nr:hypothetical protein HIM_01720 [Hirsutella minnesotensis 3608]
MPRPKRTRRAPALDGKGTEPVADDAAEIRGRTRTRSTRPIGSQLSAGEQDAIRSANVARDAALERLANEDATTSSAHITDDDTQSSIETGRRALATPAMRRDTTGLDLADDDVFGDLGDSFADGDIPQGDLSDCSVLTTTSHLKRRPRQSSIVGRNDPPIRPSSRGPTTPSIGTSFNIGLFRRRAREPSILGTSRKPLPEAEAASTHSGSESEGDFEPEAESTPLNVRQSTRRSLRLDPESSSAELAQSSSRKRKSVEAPDSSGRPDKASRVEPQEDPDDSGSDSELSDIASPSPPPAGFLQRPVTPINQDEITAPPASSDSEEDAAMWPDIHILAKRRRRPSVHSPPPADHLSDVSSPPSLTHSPNYATQRVARPRGRSVTRRQPSPKITTADLTSLLPKRKYKRVRDSLGLDSDEELDTTDLAQDDDELSYLDARAARRRKGSRPPSRATSARPASRARANNSVLKPKQIPGTAPNSTRSSKTYRRRSSDKENESDEDDEGQSGFVPLPDDTFENLDGQEVENRGYTSAEELKQAAKKFVEVDKWELEFEEVAEPPSPQDAR